MDWARPGERTSKGWSLRLPGATGASRNGGLHRGKGWSLRLHRVAGRDYKLLYFG